MPKAIYINEAAYVEGILVTGVTSLSTALSSEISVRGSSDTSLSTAISTETSSRSSVDTSLSTGISTANSTRGSADTSLSTAISTETSTRSTADTSLSTAISTEASSRNSVDTSLSTSSLQPWIDINRCGFVDNTQTSISFNDTTYTFTLSGLTAWSYYRGGIKYTINGNKTITLTGTPPTAGTYFISLDSTDGTLSQSQTPWTLTDLKLPVATIRWNNSNTPKYHIAEERHTALIDRRMHKYLHETSGTKYISGGVLTGPTVQSATDADNTFGVSDTVITDEDLAQMLTGLTRPNGATNAYNIYYRTSTTGWTWQPSEVPLKYTTTGYIEYDNNGTMTAGANSNFYNTYLLFTDQNLTARFSIISGRGQFASLSTAQAENPLNFDWTGLPIAESIIAYQLTWETSNAYGSKGKCRLAATPVRINISTTTSVGSGSGTDHNTLAGLQGGTGGQYYHLTNIDYITVTGISSALSSEISIRSSSDTSLSTAISTANSTRSSADTSLSTAISTETSSRVSDIAVVYNNLNLSGLTDVVITTPSESDIIIYSGSTWVNYTPIDGGSVYYSISGGTLYGKAIYNTAYAFSSDNELISKKYVDDLISASGGTVISNYGDNRILTSSGTTKGIVAESNLTFDGTFLNLSGASARFRFTDSSTEIWKDGSNNLSFKDAVSGTYTLSQLIVGGGSLSLSGLTDVTITSVTPNDIILYSGSTWVNTPNLFLLVGNNVRLASSSHNFYIPSGDYYYLGVPYSEGSWRWFINGNGDLEFQKCVSSVYIYKNIMV